MIETVKEGLEGYKDCVEAFMRWRIQHGYGTSFSSGTPRFNNGDEQKKWRLWRDRLDAVEHVLSVTHEERSQIIAEVEKRVRTRKRLIMEIDELPLATLQAIEQTIADAEKGTKGQ